MTAEATAAEKEEAGVVYGVSLNNTSSISCISKLLVLQAVLVESAPVCCWLDALVFGSVIH